MSDRIFRFWICGLLAMVSVGGLSLGEEGKWTSQEAIDKFHSMLNDQTTPPQSLASRMQVWYSKVQGDKIDFGDEGYILSIAGYILADVSMDPLQTRNDAVEGFADFIVEKGKLPESAKQYSGFIGNVVPKVAQKAIEDGKYGRAEKLLMVAVSISGQPEVIYAIGGQQLLETEEPEAHAALNKLLAAALVDERLDTDQKQRILTFIYGDRNEKLARKRMEEKVKNFVPFEGVDLDGNKVSVADYKGKVLLVDFWASWCRPCIMEMPNFVAAYKKYKDQGFEVLGVSLDMAGSESDVKETMAELGMTWPVLFDGKYWQSEPAVKNKIQSIPAVFLLDRNGRARYTGLLGAELEQAIEQLLAEKPANEDKGISEGDK